MGRIALYRVSSDPASPLLTVVSHELGTFDGTEKSGLSPKAAFVGSVTHPPASHKQFLRLVPGALVISEMAWSESEAMYYVCSAGNELLAIETQYGDLRAINPLYLLPPDSGGVAPCALDQLVPLFRMATHDPTDIFCAEGVGPQGDQFKWVYEQFGFQGLVFDEVWRG